jgi:UPF0755 protein
VPWFLLLIALYGIVNTGRAALRETFDGPGPLPEAADIVVPHGSVADVAVALQQAGLITHPWLFEAADIVTGRAPIQAAEFSFPAHANLRTVLAILRTGRPTEHHVTIPEGLTAAQIAELLDRNTALTGADEVPAEGAVLPATYSFEHGTTRAAILARATAAMAHDVAAAWANRAPNLPLATPAEAVVLASIVERETAKPDERARVAGVFINRLRLGMRLQADPTVVYAASGGRGVLDRKLSRLDLDVDNPYNTYRVHGLPPAPIASPSMASLLAVLHPVENGDLYFVADGTGGHVFAHTLEEHSRNVAKWRALAP